MKWTTSNYHKKPEVFNKRMEDKALESIDLYDECIDEEQNDVCGNVSTCNHFIKFVCLLNETNNNSKKNLNILEILNDFLHLIAYHNTDDEFEFISNKLEFCDINKCAKFMRNQRDRNKTNCSLIESIIDKIHCYYSHSFDIGYRLNSVEKREIFKKDVDDQKDEIDIFQNNKLKQLNEIINKKHPSNMQRKERNNRKYNQLNKENYIQNINMSETNKNNKNNDIYSFGFMFKYNYKGEVNKYGIPIKPKFSSLKEELINNTISKLTINQFDNEYKKAQIHFASDFRKKHYVRYYEFIFSVEHLLSLMVYCNYDVLQFDFSKTYRDEKWNKHDNFYFLGKYLKMTIKIFGTSIGEMGINSFYHGVSKEFYFPKYIGRVSIYSPLSTSSSFNVAANFTNHNNGLIVHFVDSNVPTKCFSVSWISDYPNESEYLFIQTEWTLKIQNIFHMKYGIEYKIMLDALSIIDEVLFDGISSFKDDDEVDKVNIKLKKLIYKSICYQLFPENLNSMNM